MTKSASFIIKCHCCENNAVLLLLNTLMLLRIKWNSFKAIHFVLKIYWALKKCENMNATLQRQKFAFKLLLKSHLAESSSSSSLSQLEDTAVSMEVLSTWAVLCLSILQDDFTSTGSFKSLERNQFWNFSTKMSDNKWQILSTHSMRQINFAL